MRVDLRKLIEIHGETSMLRLGARAGISAATMYRYVNGQTEPKVSDLVEIAFAMGDAIEVRQRRANEPLAARAARFLVGDSSLPSDEAVAAWVSRLERYADASERSVLTEASRLANPRNDPEAVFLSALETDPERLASAGIASDERWALSGAAAFDALGFDVDGPVVFWVEQPNRVRQILGKRFSRAFPEKASIILASGDDSVFDGVIAIEGINLVSPVQAAIDSAEFGGSLGRRARELAEGLS